MMKKKLGVIIVFFIPAFISSVLVKNAFLEEPPAQAQAGEEAQRGLERPQVEYKAENLRDPFQSVFKESGAAEKQQEGQVAAAPPALTVQGIVWGGSITQAIINNKVVKTGDTIEEAKVIKIDKDGVAVLFGGRQYVFPSPAQINVGGAKKEPGGGQDEKPIQF